MFCENGNAVLRIEPEYGSMLPCALPSRCSRAPLQKDVHSRLDVACQRMAANGTLVSQYRGRRVEYLYTQDGLSTAKDVRGNSWTYTYEAGRLKTKTDPDGRTITISYVGSVVASMLDQDGIGSTFKYEYDKNKREFYKQERSAAGRVKETWYNADGDIFRRDIAGRSVSLIIRDGRDRIETDEAGNKTRRDYDEWENLIKVIYPDNSEETMRYDPVYSNVLEKVDANGTITRHTYDAKGNLIQTTEAAGKPEQRITTYAYDPYGQRLTATRAADGVSAEVTRSSTYDAYGNEITKTDGEGNSTEFTYDVMGNVLTRKDARGKLWTRTYDAAGNLTRETDPLGNITRYAYDGPGNRIRFTDAKGRVTQYLYNTQNRPVEIIDPTTARTTLEYDPDGKLLKGLDPAGKSMSLSYDSSGRPKTVTDGNGNVTELTYLTAPASGAGKIGAIVYPTFTRELRYDSRGRKIRQINVLSTDKRLETRYAYDAVGNQTAVIDPLLRRTESSYDAYGRVTKTTDPAGGEVLYAYDNRDKLLSVTDPETNTTRYQYDRDNQPTRETRPEGGVIQYSYDPTGKIATTTDAKGQQARYTYDDAGHTTAIVWYATAAATTPEKTVTLSYDEIGNLTGYNDGTTSGSYVYDANNRKIGATVNYGAFTKTLAYTYTANGLKASFTGPDGVVVRYGYDANNQLNSVQLPVGAMVVNRYTWIAPTKWTFPGGVTQEKQYDPLLRPTGISVKDQASNTLLDYVYAYDDVGNIDTKQSEHGLYDYSYDSLNRVTQADNPTLPDEVYAYDGVGNRMTDNNRPGTWTYNTDNQLTGIGSQSSFTYDANGSLIQKTDNGVTTEYQHNSENRLTGITRNGSTVASYYYDPFGRRLWKETNGQRTYFLYAEEGIIAEFDSSGTPIRQYGYKPDSLWGTDPIFQKTGGQYYFYQNDHLGTPQKLVGTNGAVVWSARYQAFGEAQLDGSYAIENPLRFPGQYFDQETGLHYNTARYYDPGTGRYITSDPIGLRGGINTYTYVRNNPIIYIDPYGLLTFNWYGNWGGPGRVNGQTNWDGSGWSESDNFPREGDPGFVPPIDPRDRAYYEHDVCINNCENKSECDSNSSVSACIAQCDINLAFNPYTPPRERVFFNWYRTRR